MLDMLNAIPVTDYGIPGLSYVQELPDTAFTITPVAQSFSAVKIARAISGETEIRLLAELIDGKVANYVLERSTLIPQHSVKREVLLSKRKNEPLNESKAIVAFNAAVAKQYPAEKLRNGKEVAIHYSLK